MNIPTKKISYVLGVALLLKLLQYFFTKKHYRISLSDRIAILVRQASRWSLASEQDESPIIALLHANYGAGYLWALEDIASDEEIKRATGINFNEFKTKIINIQDKATKKVTMLCPNFSEDLDEYLITIGGNK